MMIPRILLASTLLATGGAACSGEPSGGSFSHASAEDRGLAIETAAGMPVVVGAIAVFFADFASVDPDGCVERVEDGDAVTLRGRACDDPDALRFDNQVTVDGYGDFFDDDLDDRFAVEFERFAMHGDDGALVVDGTLEVEQAADGSGTTVIDLTLEAQGKTYELSAELACEAAPGPCRYVDGRGATSVIGEFAIEGTYRERTGKLELVGDEQLTVDFDAAEGECAPVAIDGRAAADHCWDSDEE